MRLFFFFWFVYEDFDVILCYESNFFSVYLLIFLVFFVWLQNKLQDLAGKHSDVLESLTPNVRKRVDTLREIQVCF